jgi:hypothetical protein
MTREDENPGHGRLPALPPGLRGGRHVGRVQPENRQAGIGRLPGHLPTAGSETGHGFRDRGLEKELLQVSRDLGIGAQFGGKYFCHDVRVVRLPRHGASCPIGIGVSCSADRNIKAKITAEGIFLEQLETDPARFCPNRGLPQHRRRGHRPEPAHGRDPGHPHPIPGGHAAAETDRQDHRGPGYRPRQAQGAAGQRRGAAGLPQRTTSSTTPARPRPRTDTPPVPSGPPPPAAWTPTCPSFRPRAAPW